MTETSIIRIECNRCGHIWEGKEPGAVQIIVRDPNGPADHPIYYYAGEVASAYTIYPYYKWADLCSNCASALIPWLSKKE